MAALTADRRIWAKSTGRSVSLRVAAGVRIHQGGLVGCNAAGFAKPAADVESERVIGVAHEAVDNTEGADGAEAVRTHKGVFRFANSTANPVAQSQIGTVVYVEDDQTVSATTASSVAVGVVDAIDDGGVWVYLG